MQDLSNFVSLFLFKSRIALFTEVRFKGNVQSIFLCNPKKLSVNICMKMLKSTVTKKVSVCFYNLGEENF